VQVAELVGGEQHLLEDFGGRRGERPQCGRFVFAQRETRLREQTRDLKNSNPEIADKLDRDAERIEASAVDFARVRAAHLIASGTVTVRDDERSALDLLLLGNGTAALGITDGANGDDVRKAALTQIERWRQRAGDPLASPALVEVFETAARVCEAHYAGATA